MKRKYTKPSIGAIHIVPSHLLAGSIGKSQETIDNTDDYDILSRDKPGKEAPDVWGNGW